MHGAQRARALAQAAKLEPRPPSSNRARPPSASKHLSIEDPTLPEIPRLTWLPGTTPRMNADHEHDTVQQTSAANTHNTCVLARGFCEQVQNGLAACAGKQKRTSVNVGQAIAAAGPWPARAGPLGRAAARRPRT